MSFDDNQFSSMEAFENMAKAYYSNLKEKGFVFIRLFDENLDFLIDEVFDIFFKLKSAYQSMKGFMGSGLFLEMTNEQIDELRKLFSYTKNRAFQVRTNNTKCLLECVSLESRLILKLNELAKKCDHFESLGQIVQKRILLSTNNFHVEGIFHSLINN